MFTRIRAPRAASATVSFGFVVVAALAFPSRALAGSAPGSFASPVSAIAAGAPALAVSPTVVNPGDVITVTVANGPGNPTDWVSLTATSGSDSSYVAWKFLSNSTSPPAIGLTTATLQFTAPITLGTYDFRFFANNGWTKLATSSTVTVQAAVPTLSVAPPTVSPGGLITVTLANGPGNPTDWVSLTATSGADSSYVAWKFLNNTQTAPATGLTSATLQFMAPTTPGTYNFRLFANNGWTRLATSGDVIVQAPGPPTLTVSTPTVSPGGLITVTLVNGPGNPTDWVSLTATSAADSSYLAWKFLNNSMSAPATGFTSATLEFTAPMTPGTYNFRLFANNGWTKLAISSTVTVQPPTLTVSPPMVSPGGLITVTLANGPGNPTDWVSLTATSGADSSYVAWKFLNNSISPPATGLTSATLQFTAPMTAGTYNFRLFVNNGWTKLATSPNVTVASADTTPPVVSITAPASGATVSGSVTTTATATDNVGVVGVQFKLDGANLGAASTAPPYSFSWKTQGSADLVFGAVKVAVGPMTIGAGTGLTKRLSVSCPSCAGEDMVSEDQVQLAAGSAAATFTFSAPAHHLAQMAAFKASGTPGYVQGAAATSNSSGATIAQAFSSTITAGNLIVAAVAWQSNAAVSLTDSQGNVYSVATAAYDAVNDQSLAIVYAANAKGGATTVTAGFGAGTPSVRRLEIHEYSGIATTNPQDVTAMNIADGTTTADAVTSGSAMTSVTAPVSNGSHALTALAWDLAGNTATSPAVTVTVNNGSADTTPPAVALTAPAAGAIVMGGAVTVTATASDNIGVIGVQFRLDGAPLGAEDTSSPYSVSWNTTTATNGSHTLTAVARDAAGNVTTSAGTTVTVSNDTTPPVISLVTIASLTSSGATITWTTNEMSDSEVEYGLTSAYGGFSTLDVNLVAGHTVTLGSLAPNTLYHFRVRSRDVAGNLAISGDFTFTTLEGTPPVVSITAPATGSVVSNTVTVTANASDNVGVVGVQFQLDGVSLGVEDTIAPYAVAWNTTTAASGLHTLTAVARDAAGNRTTSTAVVVTVANLTAQMPLAWDPSTDVNVVGYKVYVGTTSGVYSITIDVGNLTSYTVTGLTPGTVYYFVVTSYDVSGIEGSFSNEVSAIG